MYNVQKYIATCLHGCINQNFKNYEIILIDDASTDDSVNIAKNILSKSSVNYHLVLQKENSGVAKCRNEGISRASGKYIMFLDADDYLDEDALTNMFSVAEKNNFPLVFCKAARFINDCHIQKAPADCCSYRKIDVSYEALDHRIYAGTIWGALILRSLVCQNNIRFIESLHLGEDTLFKAQLLHQVDWIIELDSVFYWWRLTPNSLSSEVASDKSIAREKLLIEHAIDILVSAERKSRWDSMMIRYIRAKKNDLYHFCSGRNIMPGKINRTIPLSIIRNAEGNFFFLLVEYMYSIFPFLESWKIQKTLFWFREQLRKWSKR